METPAMNSSAPSSSGSSITGESTLTRATSSAHGAVDKVASAADEAIRSARPAIDRVAAIAHQTVDKASSAAAPTAEWLSAKGSNLTTKSRILLDHSCNFVTKNPAASIGIALAIGVLIGRIFRSNSGPRA